MQLVLVLGSVVWLFPDHYPSGGVKLKTFTERRVFFFLGRGDVVLGVEREVEVQVWVGLSYWPFLEFTKLRSTGSRCTEEL